MSEEKIKVVLLGADGKLLKNVTDRVNQLESDLVPLVDRYEQLTTKTSLSKDEQIELKGIMTEIGQIAPSVVTEVSKYGEILEISAEEC